MPRQLLRILSAIQERPWAITERMMRTIMDIVETNVAGGTMDIEAVAARIGRPLDNTGGRVQMRGDTAIIGVEGPIFRYADIFTEISGATSVEHLATDFQAALDNPAVNQIVLQVNSPGGQVDGINEFADMVRAGSAKKPVTAYVDGLGASGAYWIASAASRVIANESSFLGSIGVVVSVTDNRDAQERQGVKRYEIVSTQSPLKRTDIRTDEGKAQLLAIADALAEIFIGRVAQFRGTTPESVASNYGRGGLMIARQAVAAGMADEVSQFEPLLARLQGARSRPITGAAATAQLEASMETNTPPPATPAAAPSPVPVSAPASTAPTTETIIQAERARCQGILTCEEAKGRKEMARHLAFNTSMSVEEARTLLKVAPKAEAVPTTGPTPASNPLAAAMTQVPNPKVGTGNSGEGADTPEAEAASILKFVPKARRAS